MTFPIAERRLTLGDRRSQQDRRNNNVPVQRDLRSARGDRRGGKERRYLHLDREALLNNLFLPLFQERESAFIKGLRLLLLPVVIATVSAFVTYNINMRQIESAEIIADSQRRSAEEIAHANREHTAQIADAELETQRLEQIIGIFTDIIKQGSKEKHDSVSLDFVKQEIASLEVYEDQAFPFLIKLREYQGRNDEYQKTVNDTANSSIQEILKNSQLQFPQAKFIGTKDEILDLRHREYMRYNLKEAEFKHVNLHGADFSHSTLCGANFEKADLLSN